MSDTSHPGIAARVRRNVLPAAVASLLLLYFGFFYFLMPEVKDLFTFGDALFQYTLRIGGVLLAGVALASLIGVRAAPLADAFVSIGVGALLILGAGMMMLGGAGVGVHQLLYVLIGGFFISAGIRNGRDYFLLDPNEWATRGAVPHARPIGGNDVPPHDQFPAGRVDDIPFEDTDDARRPHSGSTIAGRTETGWGPAPSDEFSETDISASDEDRAQGGYLASFGEEEPPPRY